MKKFLAFVLTVILLMGMAIPASAAGTGSAVTKPFLVSSTAKDCAVYFDNEIYKLSKTAQEIFEDALEKEDEVLVSDEMIPLNLFYVSTSEMCLRVVRVEVVDPARERLRRDVADDIAIVRRVRQRKHAILHRERRADLVGLRSVEGVRLVLAVHERAETRDRRSLHGVKSVDAYSHET